MLNAVHHPCPSLVDIFHHVEDGVPGVAEGNVQPVSSVEVDGVQDDILRRSAIPLDDISLLQHDDRLVLLVRRSSVHALQLHGMGVVCCSGNG